MRKIFVLAGIAAVAISSPALAKSARHHTTVKNDPATAQALANSAYAGGEARGHIFVNNNDQGTDPDARVRLMLTIDPPVGGFGS